MPANANSSCHAGLPSPWQCRLCARAFVPFGHFRVRPIDTACRPSSRTAMPSSPRWRLRRFTQRPAQAKKVQTALNAVFDDRMPPRRTARHRKLRGRDQAPRRKLKWLASLSSLRADSLGKDITLGTAPLFLKPLFAEIALESLKSSMQSNRRSLQPAFPHRHECVF